MLVYTTYKFAPGIYLNHVPYIEYYFGIPLNLVHYGLCDIHKPSVNSFNDGYDSCIIIHTISMFLDFSQCSRCYCWFAWLFSYKKVNA